MSNVVAVYETPSWFQEVTLLASTQSTNLTSYQVIGGIPFNPTIYNHTTITLEILLETTNISYTAQFRLFNVTDSVAAGADPLLTSVSLTPERKTVVLSVPTNLPSSLKTYEIQLKMSASSNSERVTCKSARFLIA
jgi:hypothetical protein